MLLPSRLILIILLSVLALSNFRCDHITCEPDDECPPIIEDAQRYELSPEDEFILDTLWMENDLLYAGVQYGGGCGEAHFALLTSGSILKSDPPQVMLKLSLDDKDPCEALVYEELCYDISFLQKWDPDSVIIRLKGFDNAWIYQY